MTSFRPAQGKARLTWSLDLSSCISSRPFTKVRKICLLKTKNNGKSLIADVRLWTRAAAHDNDDIKKESPKTLLPTSSLWPAV